MGSTFWFVLKGFSSGNLETPGNFSRRNPDQKTRIQRGLGEVEWVLKGANPRVGWDFIGDEILPSYIGISKATIRIPMGQPVYWIF